MTTRLAPPNPVLDQDGTDSPRAVAQHLPIAGGNSPVQQPDRSRARRSVKITDHRLDPGQTIRNLGRPPSGKWGAIFRNIGSLFRLVFGCLPSICEWVVRSLGEFPGSQGDVHLELLSSIAAAAIAIKLLISSATSPPPLVRCMRMMPIRSFAGSTHA